MKFLTYLVRMYFLDMIWFVVCNLKLDHLFYLVFMILQVQTRPHEIHQVYF